MRFLSLVPILLLTAFGQVLAQPTTPNSLSVSTLSPTAVILTWTDNSTNETGFQIERSLLASSGYALITTSAANTTSYLSTSLSPGTQYFYRIRATNGSGNSAYTTVASATTGVRRFLIDFGSTTYRTLTTGWNNITAPTTGSVTNLVESSGSSSTLSLQIVKDPSNGYGANNTSGLKQVLLDYPVTALQDSHYGYASGGTYKINGLDNGMNYSLRFFGCRTGVTDTRRASFTINGQQQILETANNSSQTVVFNNIVPTSGSITIDFNVAAGSDYTYLNILDIVENQATPQVPTSFAAQAISSSQINLTWNDASTNETGFQVERSATSGTGFALIASLGANATSYSDINLSSTTQYFYRVRAINALGSSAYTAEANAITLGIPPAAPVSLSAIAFNQAIALHWYDSSNNESGFQIERSMTGSGFTLLTTLPADSVSYNDNNLNGDTQYFYRVQSFNSGGNSSYTNVAGATTSPAPPNPPDTLSAIAVSSSQINVAWTDVSSNESGFEIEQSLALDTGYVHLVTTLANLTIYSDTNLQESHQYFYRVRAVNSAGSSVYTTVATATTFPSIPTAPDSLTVYSVSTDQINIQWNDHSNNESGFQIERSLTSGSGFLAITSLPTNITGYSDSNLNSETNYFYRVRALNAGGSSNYTNEAGATTFPGPPKVPTSLTASVFSATQINLSWTDASHNETGFEIERATLSDSAFVLITTTSANTTSYADTGLQPSSFYTYRIRAVNNIGSSPYTSVVRASTPSLIQPYGLIFNETSFASATRFPIVGTSITRGSNKIVLTGKPTTFSSYIYHDDATNPFRYTCLEHWKVRVKVKTPSSFNSNSTGIAIGVQSVNTYSAYSTLMRWSWVPAANSIYLYNKTSTSNQIISSTKYVPTVNTYYWIEVTRNKDSFTYAIFDGSTGANQLYSVTLTFPTFTAGNQVKAHNTGQFAIHQFGGTSTEIANWEVSTSAIKNADFIGVGDSNMHGMFASNNSQRWVESAMTTANKSFNILAGTSERTVEVVKRLPEIIALNPKAVVLSIGRNDLANSISLATVQSNINTIIATLEGAGITVYLAGVIASNTNVSALQSFYSGKANVQVNSFTATKSATSNSLASAYNSGDGIHLNPAGNTLLANLLLTILVPQAPATPTLLTASSVSASQIKLTWTDNSSNENGFQLERSLASASGFATIASLPANSNSFSDDSLNSSTQYFYRIRAVNAVGNSAYSTQASVTTASSSGERRFLIDFGSSSVQTTTTGWNNVTVPATGTIITLKESTGTTTAVKLEIIKDPSNGYADNTTKGSTTPLLDYPISALSDAHYAWQSGGTYKLTGLDNSKVYALRFFGSRTAVTDSRKAAFTINGVQQTLETMNNTTQTVVFSGIAPTSGAITINFNVATGSTYAYINVLDVTESTPSPQAKQVSFNTQTTVPVSEIIEQPRIELYPNPAQTEVAVRISRVSSQRISIHVFDMLGKELRVIEATTELDSVIDLNSLPSGLYVVHVNLGGRYYSKKFIKKD